jgi:DNA-binding NarL/FixJ family response regulator
VAAVTGEALDLVEAMAPDVVVVDSQAIHPLVVLDLVRRTAGLSPRVLVLGAPDRPRWLSRLVEAGVSGFVPTSSSAEDCLDAIVRLGRGEVAFEAESLSTLVEELAMGRSASALDELTSRERDVLAMVATGRSSKEIASALGLSPRTIDCHRTNLMQKLRIHNVVGLVWFAIREGLVSPFDDGIEGVRERPRRSFNRSSPAWQRGLPSNHRAAHGASARSRESTL